MEIDVNPTPFRKRPDVIQRLKDRKGKQERVIKCSLVGRLTEKRLLSPILSWVHTVSRISNKGSLVFNRLLLHCLSHRIHLPDLSNQTLYLQCFNVGSGRLNAPISPVQDIPLTFLPSLNNAGIHRLMSTPLNNTCLISRILSFYL